MEVLGHADPARIPVGETLPVGDLAPRAADAGASEEARVDGIADRRRDAAARGGIRHRGEARGEHPLGRFQSAQGAEFDRRVEVDVLLGFGVAVGEMDMDVDQARHHEMAGIIHHLVFRRRHGRAGARPHIGDPLALRHHRLVALRTIAEAGEQVAASNVSAHRPLHCSSGASGRPPLGSRDPQRPGCTRPSSAEQHLRRSQQFIRMFERRRMPAPGDHEGVRLGDVAGQRLRVLLAGEGLVVAAVQHHHVA